MTDPAAPDGSEPGEGTATRPPSRPTMISSGGAGGGRRLLGAVVLVPWVLGYGITGSWAVARGANAMAQHLQHIDAGYARPVSPGGLIVVGALLLAAFGVLLATALLLLTASRRRGAWTAVLIVAALLSAGAVWAGVAGHMSPGLWLLLFLGLLLALVFAAVVVARMSREPGRATIAGP